MVNRLPTKSYFPSTASAACSGIFKMWQKGGAWRARRARAYNGGLRAEPPAGSRGRAPVPGVRGAKPPWSWNTFCFWMFNGNRKFAHFSEIWKRKRPSNIVKFCNSCWKMAKNASFHIKSPVKKFMVEAKGAIAPCPLNTPLAACTC